MALFLHSLQTAYTMVEGCFPVGRCVQFRDYDYKTNTMSEVVEVI